MNATNTLKKYIGPSGGIKFLAWLLAIATIALFAVGIQQSSIEEDPSEAKWFNPFTAEAGDYVYLDIVGISNWLYKVESDSSKTVYYSVEDADDNIYTMVVSDAEYSKMMTQRTYWNREGENDPNAEVYRIYGTARRSSSEVKEALASSWSSYGLSTVSDYEYYFGTMHFDSTTTPGDSRGMGFIIGGIFALAAWICAAVASGKSKKNMKKCLKRLEELGELDAAAAEISGAVVTVGKDKCRISDNYIYTKKGGVVLSLKDILWSYRHVTKTNGINSNTQLLALTCTGKSYGLISVAGGDSKDLTTEIMTVMAERNPTILMGFSDALRVEYRARLKTYKTTKQRPADMVTAAAEAAPVEAAPAETAPVVETAPAAETAPVAETVAEEVKTEQ